MEKEKAYRRERSNIIGEQEKDCCRIDGEKEREI